MRPQKLTKIQSNQFKNQSDIIFRTYLMKIAIEHLNLDELKSFLREQAEDAFPDLKDSARLSMLAEKWHTYAEFCTCREDRGRLVGMIAFYANRPESGIVYLPHIYVSPQSRCKGVFKQMLHVVECNAKQNGFYKMKLEVQRDNYNAFRTYERTGFITSCDDNSKSLFLTKSL